MTRAHVAHDCTLGDGVVMSAGSTLGGHVVLWTRATLGMGAVVHQRRSVGPWAMVGMAGVVTRDISACQLVMGSPARPVGLNTVGLRRAGVGEHQFARLQGWLEGTEALGQDLPVLIQRALETWMRSPDDVTTGLGARRD